MIELRNITKSYGDKKIRNTVLNKMNLTIHEGEMVALIGRSGCGKTTLLNIMAGLTSFENGTVYYKGNLLDLNNSKVACRFRNEEIGMVVQTFALIDDITIYENVALPLKLSGYSRKEVSNKVCAALSQMELSDKKNAYPDELSGGQQQRVAIARAIVKSPNLILADEPTGALDKHTGEMVFNTIKDLHEQGKTIVFATHDMELANRCERIIQL